MLFKGTRNTVGGFGWLALCVASLLMVSPVSAADAGMVVDGQSGEPIEGAVVFGLRQIKERNQFQYHSSAEFRCYAVGSAVTDTSGRFDLPDDSEWAQLGYLQEGEELQLHVIAPDYRTAVLGHFHARYESFDGERQALPGSANSKILLHSATASLDIHPFLVTAMKECVNHEADFEDALPGFVRLFRTADLETSDYEQRGILNGIGHVAAWAYREEHGGPALVESLTNEEIRHILTHSPDEAYQLLALRKAVEQDDVDEMEDLIENGVNPMADDGHQRSLLWTAMEHDALGAYRYLRDVGVEWRPGGLETMLYKQARENDVEAVKLLIAEGAKGDERVDDGREVALLDAVILGHIEVVKLMLEAGADPDAVPENALGNPLQRAYDREHDEIFLLLLKYGADPNVTERRNGRGLLEKAVHAQKSELAIALLRHGADTELSINDRSLLGLAISKRDEELVEAMLDAGFSPGAGRVSPLSFAARIGWVELVDRFLEHPDAKPGTEAWWHAVWLLSRQDDRGMFHHLLDAQPGTLPVPPERFACIICGPAARGEMDLLSQYIKRGFPVNGRAQDGDTALIRASRHAKREVVEYLLANGADPSLRGENGATALAIAADSGLKEIEVLAAREAEQRQREEAARREAEQRHREVVERRRREIEARREGAEQGRQAAAPVVTPPDRVTTMEIKLPDIGNRLSHESPPQGQTVQAVVLAPDLSARRARWNRPTPAPTNIGILDLLIDSGADVNAADDDGWTPLMRAAAAGNDDVVELLLANGADSALRNDDGKTAAGLREHASAGER